MAKWRWFKDIANYFEVIKSWTKLEFGESTDLPSQSYKTSVTLNNNLEMWIELVPATRKLRIYHRYKGVKLPFAICNGNIDFFGIADDSDEPEYYLLLFEKFIRETKETIRMVKVSMKHMWTFEWDNAKAKLKEIEKMYQVVDLDTSEAS